MIGGKIDAFNALMRKEIMTKSIKNGTRGNCA